MIEDKRKTKAQLLGELNSLRGRIAQLEQSGCEKTKQRGLESNQVFQTVFNNTADGILVAYVESKKFYLANTRLCRMLGYSAEEMKCLGVTDIHPEQDLPFVEERFNKQVNGEITLAKDIPVKRKDGSVFYADVNSIPIELDGRSYLIGIFRDVTEHKKMEEFLRRNEEKFRLAMEATNDALWDWNIATNEVYRNPRHAIMLGYEPQELSTSQQEWEKRIHPDDKHLVSEIFDEYLKKGKRGNFELEYRLQTKSGGYIWVLGRGKIVSYSDDGKPLRMIGTNTDINERKKAEEEFRKFKIIAEKAGYGVSIGDIRGNLLFVNESFAQMHGYIVDELLGKHLSIFHDKEQLENTNRLNKQLIEEGNYVAEEVWHKKKDGTILCMLMNGTCIKNDRGQPQLLACTAIDITERKRMEEELFREKNRLQAILEVMDSFVTIRDSNYKIIYQNDAVTRLWGDCIGEKCYVVYEKNDSICEGCPAELAFKDGKSHISERKVSLPSGQIIYLENIANPMRTPTEKFSPALKFRQMSPNARKPQMHSVKARKDTGRSWKVQGKPLLPLTKTASFYL